MEKVIRDYISLVAKSYAKATGLALATISRRFHGTFSFLEDFKNGKRTITLRKLDEMLAAFRSEWPEDVPFPDPPLVGRPKKAPRRSRP